MPIKRCSLPNGKSGYKWGDSGHCYASREDALKQMRAIFHSGYKGKGELTLAQKAAIELLIKKEEERLNREFGEE